jgi:ABC-type phosphate transport system substrate-binding protein
VLKLVNRLAVVSLIGLPVLAGATRAAPAGASTAAHVRIVGASPASSVPKSKIIGQGSTAAYNPTALTVAEDTSGNPCNGDNFVSFKIKNKGTGTAYLTSGGSPVATLPAGNAVNVCASGFTQGDQTTLRLSNKKGTKTYASTLTLTFSD